MKRLRSPWIAAAMCFVILHHGAASAADKPLAYERLYVFGDSYSDIGEGYLDGNGPTAVAYLAERLGLKFVPSTATDANANSIDFAISGAQTGSGKGTAIEGALLGVGMRIQVDDFSTRVHAKAIQFNPQTTLFYLAGGLNDGNLTSKTTVTNLKDEIRTLYALGGRRFEVALLPTAIPSFSAAGKRLNPELTHLPVELSQELAGSRVFLSQWGPFFDAVMEHPARYGIVNTTDACAGRKLFHEDTTPCAAPQTYFYYHKGHPSTAVHRAVGDMLYQEITARPDAEYAIPCP